MPTTTAFTEVRDLEARRYQAMRDGDVATLDALLSDALVYTHSNATMDDKASYIAKIVSKYFDYLELEHFEDGIFQAGEVVFIVGRMMGRVLMERSYERRLANRSLVAWAREGDAWRLVAFQPTPIPADAPR